MKKKILFTTLIVALGLILPLILVYAGETINEPSDPSARMPTIISGTGTDQVTNEAPSAEEGNIAKLVQYIYTFAMLAAGLAVIGGLIYGGVRYLFAGGSITKMFAARGQVRNALYGLGLILISYLILYTINPALVNLTNPTADPLKLRTSPIWSLSRSYGQQMANVPKDRPCLSDFDCAYDLACCPAQTDTKQEVTSCNQDLTGTALPEKKNDFVSVPSTEATNLKWFSCGLGDAYWFQDSCPATTKSAPECSETVLTGCCDPQTKPDATKNPACCQQPLMVTAKDEAECKTIYGSQAKYNNCVCTTRVATCQKIKPPADSVITTYSWTNLWTKATERQKLSGYGDKCYANEVVAPILGFGYRSYGNNSCRDQRLVCNKQLKICIEPGEVGDPCKKSGILKNFYDCCGVQQENNSTPNCKKYISRGISLYCDQPDDATPGQCMMGDEDAEKMENDTNPMPANYTCTALTAQTTGGTMGGVSLGSTCQQLATNPINQTNKDYTIDGSSNWCSGTSSSKRCCCKATPPNMPAAPVCYKIGIVASDTTTTKANKCTNQCVVSKYPTGTVSPDTTTGCEDITANQACCCCSNAASVGTGNCTGATCTDSNVKICGTDPTANCYKTNISSYDATIVAAANGKSICAGVDAVKLIKAIISQESGGDITKNSSDGESAGLMQMKPTTAKLFQNQCNASGETINFAWLKNPQNAQKQICMAIEFLKTLVIPCGCNVRQLAAGYNGGGAALGACTASTNCGPPAGNAGQCSMCANQTTKRWECLWDNNEHTACNYDNSGGSFKYTRAYVPKVLSCYNQF